MITIGRTPPKRLLILSLLSIVIGAAVGAIGWLFLRASALMLSP